MKKLITLFIFIFACCLNVSARGISGSIKSIVKEFNIPQEAISISVKNADSGKIIYKQNDNKLMPAASVQKALTIVPIMDVLGNEYEFKTELSSRGKDGYIIKLGADPYLTSDDLSNLVKKINSQAIKQIYIDDSIIEKKDWGEGWQWDDDLNTSMPRFNSYNLDKNLVKITIMPTEENKQAFIINPQKSPMFFYNNVITGSSNKVIISRDNIASANTVKLEGTVKTPETHFITINNLKIYFDKKLTDSLEDRGIYLKTSYLLSNVTNSDKKIAEVAHPISIAIEDVLLNSNNMVIETMAKLAGGKYFNKQGTDVDGIRLFNEYCLQHGIDASGIRIVDASGVSKNNLMNADFISEFLVKNKDNKTLNKLATPSQGTLTTRMLPLKDNLKAKTGTLSDISTIAGYLTAKSGQKYAFAIMINDPKTNNSQKKNIENYLIRDMYSKL